jgi:CRP-like cAMP-binding protein
VLRTDLSGAGFFIILEGHASIQVDGEERWTLGPGDFFGEASVLTGEPPSADVVAKTLLRCVVVSGPDLEQFLLDRPQLMLRLLRAEAQRLRNALGWRS